MHLHCILIGAVGNIGFAFLAGRSRAHWYHILTGAARRTDIVFRRTQLGAPDKHRAPYTIKKKNH